MHVHEHRPDEDGPLSDAIRQAIVEHRGEEPAADEFVLYEYVDPDALDRLFRPREGTIGVTFQVEGVVVDVVSDDDVTIRVTDA